MIRAVLADRIAQAHADLAARIVHRQFLSLDLHREQVGIAADRLRRALAAFRQQIADALASGDQFDGR